MKLRRGKNLVGFVIPSGKRNAFTLIEILVSIAIIALLSALLVPSIDRSLSRNNLANDVDLLKSKFEETRLLAGSTQQVERETAGYYGIFLPGGNHDYFAVIRVSDDVNLCSFDAATGDAISGEGECLVEKVGLSKNVTLRNGTSPSDDKIVLFRSPTGQVHGTVKGLRGRDGAWRITEPTFDSWANSVKLQFQTKAATVILDDYTAKLSVTYTDN